MSSFRRIAFLLVLGLPALNAVHAQSTTSSSSTPATSSSSQQPAASGPTQGQLSVQARIKARREQRRAAAIRDVYTHLYEAYAGGGYLRFTPGPTLQRANEKSWDVGVTRFYDERLGVTIDGRGTYGAAFVEPTQGNQGITKPEIIQYAAMIGPTYRFYLQPKYSISGRAMAGFAYGDFSGDTSGNTLLSTTVLHLYPDGYTYALNASVVGEYNVSPNVAIRVAPEYFATGFGSTIQNSLGFTAGVVYRFGKQ
jgi:hypothetical protein